MKKFFMRMPLSMRLTLYFTIFGLFIGYLSFILVITGTARTYISIASSSIISKVQEIHNVSKDNFIDEMLSNKNKEYIKAIDFLDQFLTFKELNVRYTVYFRDDKTKTWRYFYKDNNSLYKSRAAQAKFTPNLDRCLIHGVCLLSTVFWGKSDTFSIITNISKESKKDVYVLKIDADREGLLTRVRKNKYLFVIFILIIFALSVILGKMFAYHISKPIKILSEESSIVAGGNYGHRFSVCREDEIGMLSDSLNVMAGKIEEDVNEIQRRVDTMETMNMIDKAVLSSISRNDLLDKVVGIVSKLFNKSSISIAFRNYEKNGYDILSFFQGGSRSLLGGNPFISDSDIPSEILDVNETIYQVTKNSPNKEMLKFFTPFFGPNIASLINIPIFLQEKYLGPLLIARESDSMFSTDEIDSIRMLADQVGIAVHSIHSFEEKENLLMGILLALTRSIDAKSKWTAGHSERVAQYAESIALKMGFDEDQMRTLTFSAILHDIGKIAVPEQILDKPSKLSSEEYSLIQQHPKVGARIIADIPSYDKILPGILYHHEQWCGNGYPEGLSELDIPINSRIISLADVYDAITADRPYRNGMTRDEAHEFIINNKKVMFDPEIVEIFIETLESDI